MNDSFAPGARSFATTQWSRVRAAGIDDTQGAEALERICRDYWYPLYAFVRRRGHGSADAKDLTQSFFASLIEKNTLARADAGRGKLRTFLLAAMQNFLANEHDRAHALKRGGGAVLEWDALDAEGRLAAEPAAGDATAEMRFDQQWARTLVERALELLRAEHESAGKGALFAALRGSLTGAEPPRAETMAALGLSESAVKAAVHRLRARYREMIRAEVARTVEADADVEAEMRHLAALLRQ